MKTIYTEIEQEQQKEIEEMEIEFAEYTASYNGIKNHPASKVMRGSVLKTLEGLLYAVAAVLFVAFVWVEGLDLKMWSHLLEQGKHLSPIGGAAISANALAWKTLTASLFIISLALRWLVGRIRTKNQIMHEQGELLTAMLNKLGTNLYKLKESQKHFEALDPELHHEAAEAV